MKKLKHGFMNDGRSDKKRHTPTIDECALLAEDALDSSVDVNACH